MYSDIAVMFSSHSYPCRHSHRRWYCVQVRLSVCLSVCPHSKRKKAINTKLGTHILYNSRSACIDPDIKSSKVKVTRLRKPSRLLVTMADVT